MCSMEEDRVSGCVEQWRQEVGKVLCLFFFFRRKTADGVRLGLGGSEVCIRGRGRGSKLRGGAPTLSAKKVVPPYPFEKISY